MKNILSIYAPLQFYIKYPKKLHIKAYKDNLKLVLPYALKLAMILPGRVVITSDYGEAFGEWIHPLIPIKVYGHIENIRIPDLVKVPWLIIEEKDKKKIPEVLKRLS